MRADSSTEEGSTGPVQESAGFAEGKPRETARLGMGGVLYLAFLSLLALFSIVHGLGSAALNMRNLDAAESAPDGSVVGIYVSDVAVHSLRVGLGLVLLALVILVVRRPSERGRLATRTLAVSVIVVVFDAIAVMSMAIHSTTYASDPLLEWSANSAFAPWLTVVGLMVVSFGHGRVLRTVGAPRQSGASRV